MADDLSPEVRRRTMRRIRSADTTPELVVRRFLFRNGFRFRKNVKTMPGKPDIVLPKYRTVIFVHGCFWHQHPGCRRAVLPKSREDYWLAKLKRNAERDAEVRAELEAPGWRVLVVWECELKPAGRAEERLCRLRNC